MNVRITQAVLICLFVSAGALAAGRPDFSGTWVLDSNRSISIPPNFQHTMIVVHSGDQMKVENKLVTAQGERSFNDVYTLNNQVADFTPQGPAGAAPGKGKRKAYWLPNDRGIVVNDETTTESPNGPVVTQQTRKWTLSSDGSTLTIDFYIDGPRGSFETKRIYDKK